VLNKQDIKATHLGDAWFQTLFRMLNEGSVFTIDRGSYAGQKRLEFDYVDIHITHPGDRPLIPQIEQQYNIPNPVADDYLDDYIPYLMTGEIKEGEAYTYGQRLMRYPIPRSYLDSLERQWKWSSDLIIDEIPELFHLKILSNGLPPDVITHPDSPPIDDYLNQIELLIWTYKNKGFRNNQMVLQVAHPSDMLLKDPPCLRHIDTRIQDGKLHFYPYFRSWDAYSGFPANLAAIQLLKEYVAAEIGVEDGEIIASSKGLHIYDYTFDLAKCLRMQENMKLKGE